MIRAFFFLSKWLFISVVTLIVLLVVIVTGALYTESGLRVATWGAEKALPALSIESASGRLGNQFTLSGIRYEDPDLHISSEVKKLTLSLQAQCLFQPAICIDALEIDGLNVTLPTLPETTEPETESKPVKVVNAPLPIRVNGVSLNDINLNILGNSLTWESLSTGVNWRRNKLVLASTDWQGINVRLAKTDSKSTTTSSVEPKTIELPEVWIPLNIDISRFNIERATLEQQTPITINQLTLAAQAKNNEVDLKSLHLDMPQGTLDTTLSATLKGDYPLKGSISTLAKLPEIKGQTAQALLSGSAADLGLKLTLDGHATGVIEGQVKPLEPELPFDVSITDLKGQWPLVAQSADYEADLENITANGSLNEFYLKMKGKFSGKSVPSTALQVEGKGSQSDIQLSQITVDTLGGQVSGQLTASWKSMTQVNTDLVFSNIQPNVQWPDIPGDINGNLSVSAVAGGDLVWQVKVPKLDINGELLDYPLDINGVVSAQQKSESDPIEVTTPGLTLAHGSNKVFATGRLDKQWDMDVTLNLPDLSKSIKGAAGAVTGDIKLTGEMEMPLVDLDVQASQLGWQDQLKIASASIQGKAQPLPTPQANIQINIDQLSAQDQSIDHIELDLNGDAQDHQLSLQTQAPWGDFQLELLGQLNQSMTQWVGTLQKVELTNQPNRIYLASATEISANLEKQSVVVDAHCWREGEASLCLREKSEFSAEKAQAQLQLSKLNFEQIRRFLPEDTQLVGQADADLNLEYLKGKDPKVDADIRISSGKVVQNLEPAITVGWNDIQLKAHLSENQLNSNTTIDLVDNGSIDLQANVQNITDKSPQVDGNINITNITLDALAPMFGEYSKANAAINSQIELKGDALHPQAFGQLIISNIIAQGDITPVDVSDGQLTASFNGYQATIDAKIETADGALNIDGDADWHDLEKWSLNSHVFADQLQIRMPPMVDIKASPDLKLAMEPGKAKVDGDINLPWGRIVVEELPASATSISSDQVIVNADLEPVEEKASLPMNIETNVNINIGDDFRLEAFGLKGNLTGMLNVTQRENSPFVAGEVNIVDGTYRSFGQDLVIQKGQILMNGPVDKPYVAITAIRNPDNIEDDVTAGIKVTGPADSPTVSVFSDPSMAQANALSYLLRGQDLDAESGDNSMTTTLIGLSLAQSGKVVGEIGQAFGVQDLQLDTAGSGDDSQVTVSGYVLPGLQVKYGVGIFTSVGEFTVRYRLMKDLYVEAVSGLTSAVDLLYQFDFD